MNGATLAGDRSWRALVRAAVVGTQRDAAPVPSVGDADLDALLASAAAASPEAALLRGAAVLQLARRAGSVAPDLSGVGLEPAPDEVFPRCSRASAADLDQILGDGAMLLPEWLACASAARVRVPEESLPRVLSFGADRPPLRPAITAVLGERGVWLARLEATWTYATGGDDAERVWHEGDKAARIAALRRLRANDPVAARELLAAGWESEAPAERAALIDALAEGLSAGDEAFLESALDERRKDVRTAAATLLGRLPQSRFAARAIARIARLVRVESGFPRKPSFAVELPADCDAAMERDGVERLPPAGIGERAWWLQQLIERVPPAHWNAMSRLDALTLLEASARSEFADALGRGFERATLAYGDEAWRAAWIDRALALPGVLPRALRANAGAGAEPVRRAALVRALRTDGPAALHLTLTFPGPWDDEFSREVVRFIARAIVTVTDAGTRPALVRFLAFAAQQVSPTAPGLEEEWPSNAPDESMSLELERFRTLVRFRAAMRAHLGVEAAA